MISMTSRHILFNLSIHGRFKILVNDFSQSMLLLTQIPSMPIETLLRDTILFSKITPPSLFSNVSVAPIDSLGRSVCLLNESDFRNLKDVALLIDCRDDKKDHLKAAAKLEDISFTNLRSTVDWIIFVYDQNPPKKELEKGLEASVKRISCFRTATDEFICDCGQTPCDSLKL